MGVTFGSWWAYESEKKGIALLERPARTLGSSKVMRPNADEKPSGASGGGRW